MGPIDPRVVVHRRECHCHPEGRSGVLDCSAKKWGEGRGVRIEDDSDPHDTRCSLLQQLEPFPH